MPEGPEIRRAADQLAAALAGPPLVAAFFAFPALKPHEAALAGRRIEAITARGKALLIRFDHGWTLYSHNQLYGVWKIAGPGQRPRTVRSLRVVLETADRAALLYSASDVAMWRTDQLQRHPYLQRLGPDVLDPSLDTEAVAARLSAPPFCNRGLPGLLLDQGFLAGMGNYLRAEVLFEAGIAPQRKPQDLDEVQRRCLARALLAVPRRSYRSRGIQPARGMKADYLTTTPDGFRFQVFDRAGQPCLRCGGTIERAELGGRRLYWCPRCQR